MTNVATYKRRRDASWLRGKTNRGGVKGRMIGSHSQILPTNSISPEILKQIFSNTGIPVTTCEIEQTLVTVITLWMQKKENWFETKQIWERCPDHFTVSSGGNKPLCVFFHTCVGKPQHLFVWFFHTYVVISTRVCKNTHLCGKNHTDGNCVVCGYYHTHVVKTKHVWK